MKEQNNIVTTASSTTKTTISVAPSPSTSSSNNNNKNTKEKIETLINKIINKQDYGGDDNVYKILDFWKTKIIPSNSNIENILFLLKHYENPRIIIPFIWDYIGIKTTPEIFKAVLDQFRVLLYSDITLVHTISLSLKNVMIPSHFNSHINQIIFESLSRPINNKNSNDNNSNNTTIVNSKDDIILFKLLIKTSNFKSKKSDIIVVLVNRIFSQLHEKNNVHYFIDLFIEESIKFNPSLAKKVFDFNNLSSNIGFQTISLSTVSFTIFEFFNKLKSLSTSSITLDANKIKSKDNDILSIKKWLSSISIVLFKSSPIQLLNILLSQLPTNIINNNNNKKDNINNNSSINNVPFNTSLAVGVLMDLLLSFGNEIKEKQLFNCFMDIILMPMDYSTSFQNFHPYVVHSICLMVKPLLQEKEANAIVERASPLLFSNNISYRIHSLIVLSNFFKPDSQFIKSEDLLKYSTSLFNSNNNNNDSSNGGFNENYFFIDFLITNYSSINITILEKIFKTYLVPIVLSFKIFQNNLVNRNSVLFDVSHITHNNWPNISLAIKCFLLIIGRIGINHLPFYIKSIFDNPHSLKLSSFGIGENEDVKKDDRSAPLKEEDLMDPNRFKEEQEKKQKEKLLVLEGDINKLYWAVKIGSLISNFSDLNHLLPQLFYIQTLANTMKQRMEEHFNIYTSTANYSYPSLEEALSTLSIKTFLVALKSLSVDLFTLEAAQSLFLFLIQISCRVLIHSNNSGWDLNNTNGDGLYVSNELVLESLVSNSNLSIKNGLKQSLEMNFIRWLVGFLYKEIHPLVLKCRKDISNVASTGRPINKTVDHWHYYENIMAYGLQLIRIYQALANNSNKEAYLFILEDFASVLNIEQSNNYQEILQSLTNWFYSIEDGYLAYFLLDIICSIRRYCDLSRFGMSELYYQMLSTLFPSNNIGLVQTLLLPIENKLFKSVELSTSSNNSFSLINNIFFSFIQIIYDGKPAELLNIITNFQNSFSNLVNQYINSFNESINNKNIKIKFIEDDKYKFLNSDHINDFTTKLLYHLEVINDIFEKSYIINNNNSSQQEHRNGIIINFIELKKQFKKYAQLLKDNNINTTFNNNNLADLIISKCKISKLVDIVNNGNNSSKNTLPINKAPIENEKATRFIEELSENTIDFSSEYERIGEEYGYDENSNDEEIQKTIKMDIKELIGLMKKNKQNNERTNTNSNSGSKTNSNYIPPFLEKAPTPTTTLH
ncbi:hypothetical protein DICPUDRAFT_155809 [Dictyostelium purpureum]|uniref:Uncharacterized protein n=1 Tax=Dictyostelium purpureum TaxID=5786 RepID=F0ZUY2_DICPU|nr:uncharacterized protein DICPUDRAFT_155809 [Dictyostelium purpureum]EGC32259.1 hypothetical protein DICPUDRAFT_155809 [Dictyostelium purpureum]|eukprot:XP_003291226.1 hypothetical protein DICPUDRAFT_155809 [Dictyostelium purpureum]